MVPSFASHPVTGDLRLRIVDARPIASDLLSRVDLLWARRPDGLFDGPIYAMVSIQGGLIEVARYSYKIFWAGWQERILREAIGLLPIGVRGVVQCHGKIAIGRRPPNAGLSPNFLEFAPAGSLDDDFCNGFELDYRAQLLNELEEEVGADGASVSSFAPFLLVANEKVADLVCAIELAGPPEREGREYSELFWMDAGDLRSFVERHADEMVPCSLEITKAWHTHRREVDRPTPV